MRIPTNPDDREFFYLDLIRKCQVSQNERKGDYNTLRSFYLFGAGPDESPALYNKIHPHIDQLTSFLYSAETTRFSITLGAAVNPAEHKKTPVLTRALNDEWVNSNADQVFSTAASWSLVYNTTYVKLIWNKGLHPYMVDPHSVGVLREDIPYTDRQEAICHTYYITKSDLYSRLYAHPKRDQLVKRITAAEHDPTDTTTGLDRVIMSQVNPTMYGNVNLDLNGVNRYKPQVAEETIEMTELWVWNDEIEDYQVVTKADPDVIIYDRPGESVFLKGELPFVQICPNPLYDYYWGESEVGRLIFLQQLRNKRMTEILDLLSRQVNPPTALTGFVGILDEKNFALNRPGGLLATDMPNAKVERLAPVMPQDLFREIREIDGMFEEASGIVNVLQGKGEAGVRSSGHASQLARLGSSRAKKRALVIEDSLEKLSTLYLKCLQAYDDTHFSDEDGNKFIAEQFTKDYVVKVDAHSNSPIFMEDLRALAFNLFKAQVIDKESLLDLLDPPMKQLLKDRLKKLEAKQAQAAQAEQQAKQQASQEVQQKPEPGSQQPPQLKVM
jgi:hypothetical protein